MIGDAETPLTLAGFIAIASLAIGAIGLALKAASGTSDLRERIARMETRLEDHFRNGGGRHEHKE